jgi:ATP-dependent Clp protease ATP-binding subunit ClpC
MFERFTESARRVIVLAQEEARELRHDHIGPEHLLLGLARESQGGASRALAAGRATPEALRAAVRDTAGEGAGIGSGQIPFTPAAKQALELALQESSALGYSYIATEHLLLGLLAAETEIVEQVLAAAQAGPQRIREETLRILEDTKPLSAPSRRRPGLPQLDDAGVTLAPATQEVWTAAAGRALAEGRTEVLAADLLAVLLSDEHLAGLLASAGLDAGAAVAALEDAGRPPESGR